MEITSHRKLYIIDRNSWQSGYPLTSLFYFIFALAFLRRLLVPSVFLKVG